MTSANPWIPPLTRRELDVLRLIVRAQSGPQIAEQLGISIHSVKTYVNHLHAKLSACNRVDLAVKAIQVGLVKLSELPPPIPRELQPLTQREEDVLALLTHGALYRDIGEQLGITPDAVKDIVRTIQRKWDATSQKDVVAIGRWYRRRQDQERPERAPAVR